MLVGVLVSITITIVVGVALVPTIVSSIDQAKYGTGNGTIQKVVQPLVSFSVPEPTWALVVNLLLMLCLFGCWIYNAINTYKANKL
jgi:hypothetical protein